jgi:hypothetical protein
MVDFEIKMEGGINHRQSGAKSELGVASDHLVLYYDPDNMEKSKETIERGVRLHQYFKELKSGFIPKRPLTGDDPLETTAPKGGAK